MDEAYARSMEELSSHIIRTFCKGILLSVPVDIVSKHWASYRGKMDADLVHTSRFESAFDEAVLPMYSFLQ